jgi:hypothetical protein
LDWIVSERVLQNRLASLKQGLSSKGDMNLAINAQILAVESRINAIIGHIQQGMILVSWDVITHMHMHTHTSLSPCLSLSHLFFE